MNAIRYQRLRDLEPGDLFHRIDDNGDARGYYMALSQGCALSLPHGTPHAFPASTRTTPGEFDPADVTHPGILAGLRVIAEVGFDGEPTDLSDEAMALRRFLLSAGGAEELTLDDLADVFGRDTRGIVTVLATACRELGATYSRHGARSYVVRLPRGKR